MTLRQFRARSRTWFWHEVPIVNRLQFRVLYRQFLLRVVDLELLAPQGDITKLLGQFVALLAIVSLWILLPSVQLAAQPSSPDLGLIYAWVEAHFLVSTRSEEH